MKSLQLSRDVKLPIDTAVTQTYAVLGKRGSGKTNTASVLFEQLVKAGQPAVYVDPIGVTWGLRHSRDGKSEGLPVIILGGEHADVPLEEGGGAIIADFIIEHRQPVVVDLGLFSKSAQRRFMVDFSERLYHKNREALHVMLDECDTFVPQRIDHGGERLVGAVNDLVRKGRARGLGVTLISQRPALVNKDVLTQVETLVAHRMTGPQDRDAIERWIEYNADDDVTDSKTVLASLQSLGDGEAWVWSPSWLKLLARTRMNLRETFDSSATPKAGARVVTPKKAAEVDLGELRTKLAATIEKAKADDPRELRRKIADLEKQAKRAPAAPAETKRVEVPLLTKEQEKKLTAIRTELGTLASGLVQLDRKLEALTGVYTDHRKDVQAVAARVMVLADALADVRPLPAKPVSLSSARPRSLAVPVAARAATERPALRPASSEESNGDLPKGERLVLTCLAQHPEGCTRDQISALTGYKRQTRDDYISRLSRKGFTNVPQLGGRVFATQEGVDALGSSFEPLPTGEELLAHWRSKLPRGERMIFDVLVEAWPDAVTREDITEKTGFKRQTRDDYISRIVRKKIVDKPQLGAPIRVSEALMAHAQ